MTEGQHVLTAVRMPATLAQDLQHVPGLAPRDSAHHRPVPPRRADDPRHVPRVGLGLVRIRAPLLGPRLALVHAQGSVDQAGQGADQLARQAARRVGGLLARLLGLAARERLDQLYADGDVGLSLMPPRIPLSAISFGLVAARPPSLCVLAFLSVPEMPI